MATSKTLEARNESVASPILYIQIIQLTFRFYEFYEQAYKELIAHYEPHWQHYSEQSTESDRLNVLL